MIATLPVLLFTHEGTERPTALVSIDKDHADVIFTDTMTPWRLDGEDVSRMKEAQARAELRSVFLPTQPAYAKAIRLSLAFNALRSAKGNRTVAARTLNLSRQAVSTAVRESGWIADQFPPRPGNPKFQRG